MSFIIWYLVDSFAFFWKVPNLPMAFKVWFLLSLVSMKKREKNINIPALLFFIAVSQASGLFGAIATTPAIDSWYVYLNKPFFTPPGWLFGPVWTLLYLLMGVAAYRVYQKGFEKKQVKNALYLFATQLGLNTLWSYLFFGYKLLYIAYIEIIILWIFIFLTIKAFNKVDRLAGKLMIPYLLWVTFASFLNLAVAFLN